MKDSQNSTGFFATKLISEQSLIPAIPNFDHSITGFPLNSTLSFSDSELGIPERLMLGKRAERYFSEWVRRSSEFDLVAENIQVIDQKQTLGEFDFIVRRKSDDQLIHVELVYKFYLFDPAVDGNEFEHWIGPNRGDQLDFKLDKLQNHQFPLLFSEAAKNKLENSGIDTSNIEQQVLFLANLFTPINHQVDFQEVNKNAIEGSWMNLDDWVRTANSEDIFAIPSQVNWFSRKLEQIEWLTKTEIMEKIMLMHTKKRSPLVYSKDVSSNQSRDFVVWW
ncbi:MAG: DUF1853 family protein [Crocinitomicaceae bacterium]|nr:DUF1853 family protein [Crocinitomicaceae bacterium]